MIQPFLIVAIFTCCQELSSQTTTKITYDNSSGLSTSKCNVFDPPLSVGGKTHTGVIGGVRYVVDKGLQLPTNYSFSSNKTNRTDYRISFPFKQGYVYTIKFTAAADVNHILSGTSIPNNPIPFFNTLEVIAANCSRSCFFSSVSALPIECAE